MCFFVHFFVSVPFDHALRLNIPPVIDEVATVASPMYLAGYDWSETLYAMGGYYFKYGGGMVYYPLVVLIKDPYVLYRSMLAFNAVVCSFIPVIAFVILKKHFGVRRSSSWVMSLITFCLPVTALYTLYARADAMLIFTPWLIALIILTLVKISVSGAAGEEKKRFRRKKVILSILLALVTCASYSFQITLPWALHSLRVAPFTSNNARMLSPQVFQCKGTHSLLVVVV